jgi:O-succinylhomoserine sulfhydrylase
MMKQDKDNFETKAIRMQTERSSFGEHSAPIYLTSSFVFDDAEHARALFADEVQGNIYTRYSNPNGNEFIEKLCALEGTEDGIATASGMAAMYCSMAALLKSGDHVLASRSVFGSTHQILNNLFPRFNISHTYADIDKPQTWEAMITPATKMIFVETPSNPALDLIDLEWLGALAKKHNLILNVDNCFATPYLQNPAKWGHRWCSAWNQRIDQGSALLRKTYRASLITIQCLAAFQKFGNVGRSNGKTLSECFNTRYPTGRASQS